MYSIKDEDQVKCMKDEEGKIIIQERDIKHRWKMYFHNLFNEGYVILLYSNNPYIRQENQNYNYHRQIQEHEVK